MLRDKDYEEHRALIRSVASRVYRRLRAAGARSVQFEDVVSELSVAWVVAKEAFDPSRGVPFEPFLRRGMFNHINRWVELEMREVRIAPFELDFQSGGSDDDSDVATNRMSFDVASQVPGADQIVIDNESRTRFFEKLSPMAAKFVEILENPPIELVREVEALQARSVFARSRGINSTAPKAISPQVVFDLMAATRTERTQIYEEIRAASARVSQ